MYSTTDITRLIEKYIDLGGEVVTIEEGCLGHGKLILHSAPKKCSIIITEVFLNEWSSAHKIRQYQKLPKKYQKFI